MPRRRKKTKFDTAVTIKLNKELLDKVYDTAYKMDMDGSEFMRRALMDAVAKNDLKTEFDVYMGAAKEFEQIEEKE